MTQAINQLAQSVEKGQLDLAYNPNTVTALISGADAAIVAGAALKMGDSLGKMLTLVPLAADTEQAFGVVVRNLRGSSTTGEMAEIALAENVVYMEAGAAIARGAQVEYDVSEVQVITDAGTNPPIGMALDKATAAGDLIRVLLKTPLMN